MKADKLIISNRSALQQKYSKGFASIKKDIQRLIAADKKRGFDSVVCYVDDSPTMKKVKGKPVKKSSDAKAVKSAIDALCKAYQPDYILIFGAPDIVPFVLMKNPIYDPPEGDTDFRVESDLPYCCDNAYSTDPEKFFSPTRVVGRLPDIVGYAEPNGDPSLVLVNNSKIFSPKSKGANEKKKAPAQRKNRRAMLQAKGVDLGRSISPPRKQKRKSRPKKLNELLKPYQMQGRSALSFRSRKSFTGPGKSLSGGVRFHIVTKRKGLRGGRAGIQPIEAVIVKEIGGNLVDIKKYEAK